MKNNLIAFRDWLLKIIKDAFTSIVKGFVERPVKSIITALLSLGGVVFMSDPQAVVKSFQTFTADEQMRRQLTVLTEEGRQLRGELKSAYATNYYERKQFEKKFKEFAEQTGRDMKAIKDSLAHYKKIVVATSQGSGTAHIADSGEVVKGRYSDDWIDATVSAEGGRIFMQYDLNLEVSDVGMTVEDQIAGGRNEIYSVKLRSKKNPGTEYLLDNYVRRTTYSAIVPAPAPKPQQSSINGNLEYAGYGVEAGLSFSFWTLGSWKFPDVGISTDFDHSFNLSAGVRYNVGTPLPLFQDLWITVKYGYNFPRKIWNPLIGIGTTL